MLWRSALRSDCTAALALAGARSCARHRTVRSGLFCVRAHCIVLRSRRRTRYVRCAHSAQTAAASQMWMRAARADLRTALLVATEIAPTGHRLPRCNSGGFRRGQPMSVAKAHSGRLQRASGAPSSAGLAAPARSADQHLTRRGCLNAASKASEVSSAAGHETEQHRGVGAKRRPLQRSAAACPDAPLPPKAWRATRTAMSSLRHELTFGFTPAPPSPPWRPTAPRSS